MRESDAGDCGGKMGGGRGEGIVAERGEVNRAVEGGRKGGKRGKCMKGYKQIKH